jgi:membrane protease YdiL (CAAX protease family)
LSAAALRRALLRRPLASFFVLAFTFSWACWSVPALGYRDGLGGLAYVLGGFGPLVAAATMTRLMGASVGAWLKGLFVWRVAPRWYAFAIGVPVALVVAITAEFALFGEKLDWSILDERLIAFLPSLVLVALAGGGNEEPGWRGFALPRLQDRMTPVRATLLLGVLWAPWHLPLLFASADSSHGLPAGGVLILVALTLVSIVGYAFAYTYLLNRTGSVLLCILMHAGFNTALSSAGLRTEAALQKWDYVLMLALGAVTIWAAVAALIRLTGGELGRDGATVRGFRPPEAAPPLAFPAAARLTTHT